MARVSEGDKAQHWRDRANLLTPLAKAFSTDVGMDVASLGVQVHGGMGFIEETGAAALYRDARIAPIYEGTNGIQAIDLVTRKLPLGEGQHVHGYIGELGAIVDGLKGVEGFGRSEKLLREALDDLTEATRYLQEQLAGNSMQEALSAATPYQRLISLVAGGAYLAQAALAGQNSERVALARFFAENMLGEVAALKERVLGGAESLSLAGASLITA
jgi:alkylation response protein AidB-like acyl-CoA dehydrogenase